MRKTIFLFLLHFSLYGSEVPDFKNINRSKNVVFFLSTPKSGTNLVSGSLSAITRKPISWLRWKMKIFNPSLEYTQDPSYNRLELPLVSDKPLMYRTHYDFEELMKVSSCWNKLIFLTRNPKELLFRRFFLESSSTENPDIQFIENFLSGYLQAFKVFDGWFSENKCLVFYEDFISCGDEILLDLLKFMDEEPNFIDDYQQHKEEYTSKLLNSYAQQHTHNAGGSSSINGPKTIHYTKDVSFEALACIDEYIKTKEPLIWEKYLKRFQSFP